MGNAHRQRRSQHPLKVRRGRGTLKWLVPAPEARLLLRYECHEVASARSDLLRHLGPTQRKGAGDGLPAPGSVLMTLEDIHLCATSPPHPPGPNDLTKAHSKLRGLSSQQSQG